MMWACEQENEKAAALLMQATKKADALDVQDNKQRSALHYASSSGLESIVAKLLSLGADAALKDEVRACSYMITCMYSVAERACVHICKCGVHVYLSIYNAYHTDMLHLYVIHVIGVCVCACVSVCV